MLEQTATKAADSLLDKGVLGTVCVILLLCLCVAGFVIRSLYQDIKALHATGPADREKLVTAQQAAATAAEKVVGVLDQFRVTLSAQTDAHEDLTRQLELAAQETRHSLANVSAALNGIAGRLDRDRDRENARGRP